VDKLKDLVKSRKFWAAAMGLVMVALKGFYPDLPVDEETISNLVYVLIAYILGTAVEDGLKARAL